MITRRSTIKASHKLTIAKARKAAIKARKDPSAPYSASSFALLTPGNPKTEKGRGKGFVTFILHLAPAKLSGYQVCPMATLGCRAACLNTAGRGGIMAGHGTLTEADVAKGIVNAIQAARIRRTKRFFEDRDAFMADLVSDIERAIRYATRDGYTPVFRLNGTSDIRWETIACVRMGNLFKSIMHAFSDQQFYDYTKLFNRKGMPSNYALTFSLADGNDEQANAALNNGMNVAAVFRDKETVAKYIKQGFAPREGAAWSVVCGDDTDLRFLDPKGVIVALYAKGNAKRDTSGFVCD